jgi:hypothetical protein
MMSDLNKVVDFLLDHPDFKLKISAIQILREMPI